MRYGTLTMRCTLCAALFLNGCAQTTSSSADPNVLAEKVTRAVYSNDLNAVLGDFDEDLKKQVTRREIGALSDKMHLLGEVKSLTQRAADPEKGRYDYEVVFEHGKMTERIRLDPNGKVGAYRLDF